MVEFKLEAESSNTLLSKNSELAENFGSHSQDDSHTHTTFNFYTWSFIEIEVKSNYFFSLSLY
jgi:hypothetical protein